MEKFILSTKGFVCDFEYTYMYLYICNGENETRTCFLHDDATRH